MVTVVGGGLAGVEAAWAAANLGSRVRLYEMRPATTTPAHTTDLLAELVCSNSLKSANPDSPAGLLKEEMRAIGSLTLAIAERNAVPGGQALAVDRAGFAREVTAAIEAHPRIDLRREEFHPSRIDECLTDGPLVLATGPLSSQPIAEWLAKTTGRKHLYFYDAVSPTVEAASIDMSIAFAQSRYDKGEGADYLNCPFNREEYETFVRALVSAERAPLHAFEAGGVRSGDVQEGETCEKVQYFSGCMPIEAIAERGERSLAFGNFKPVGLTDPRTGRRPYAATQLRAENRERTLYSLVACQNRLRFGEQKRVFQLIPGLQHAEFVRYGVIHRNTYVDSPRVLSRHSELLGRRGVFLAGQLMGVEGYVESAAMGILVGWSVAHGAGVALPPRETALGSLMAHLQDQTERDFAPMNINWGLLPEPPDPARDKGVRRAAKLAAARRAFSAWLTEVSSGVRECSTSGLEV